ncbi:MAG: hypothetical protein WDL87_07935 [Candidatus Omnitrophota bacterium]|jgi:hypothetical protein
MDLKQHIQKKRIKGQATTELAVAGVIIIMMLGYLMQQGFVYNSRQALEMYTFRRALQLTKSSERGVNLTVTRDLIVPSFFSSIGRQRIQAASSVEINPWIIWMAKEDEPQDIGTYQVLQLDEKMIRDNQYVLIPPTLAKIKQADDEEDPEWMWVPSPVREIDPQTALTLPAKTAAYSYTTNISENRTTKEKETTKTLTSQDIMQRGITFQTAAKMKADYLKDPDIASAEVNGGSIPDSAIITIDETVTKTKNVRTPYD